MNKATGYGKNSFADQLFLIGELILLLASSLAASFVFHHFFSPIPFDVRLINAVVFAAVVMLCALSVGLYDQQLRESHGGILKRVIITLLFSAFLLEVVVFNLFSSIAINGWYMLLASTIAVALISSFRAFFHYHDVTRISRRRVLILGAGERASIIERRMRRTVDRRNFEIVGFVRVAGDKEDALQNETVLDLDVQEELFQFVMENAIDQMVIACDERRNMLPVEHLFKCKTRGIDVVEILDFIEQETGQIAVNLIYPSWVIYSNGFDNKKWLKTNLDYRLNFLLGLFVLALTWPIMVVTALLIYFEDGRRTGASIFYKQVRVGIDGKPFHIIKFRSMRSDAEAGGAQWATKDDDRVTRVGRVIRKYRIDELPQLFNVFRGEMGFVGPRPERPEFVCELEKDIPYYAQRHNVKPGLTGWAQLKYPYGSTSEDALEKLKFDLYYIKHRSLLLDLVILIRTVEIVLFGKGR
ncbi:TIGR03013 family XrtA/PEP-CTERM system glycosyltransferase [Alkalimonas amylolytica]|uniref:Sugar transferase, PEP-CTERM system associated/exopolysaccharide biosynthesis polyprenyl glycosylphosphotransferase n=1 Tax=Alkalimonas amylolytica TaxID=152573 RepID=A0A1H4CBM3_ALKAM|nr:TIGR03013 family XrtA/PEP-CTERM system glycosyltransferase [Alkalimonas amylolytica]SEA57689.1 sugar transferase, PEP-CTERM system associated/exopolysaccharide biosynthesis polyprenyl glycosylphosphotransferase [Alkalimonas amylolytica]